MKKIIFGATLAVALSFTAEHAFAATVTVQKGDTLYSIAKNNGVTVSNLTTWNNLTNTNIYVGQVLNLNTTPKVTDSTATPTYYTVVKGDTLWKISQANKVSVSDIEKWNNITNGAIYVGQKLQVSAGDTTTAVTTTPTVSQPTQPVVLKTYKVVSGDTLTKIANANGLTVAELEYINNLKTTTLYVGQILVVDKNATKRTYDANQLISDAEGYIGVPYLWGGTTPSGFDCSGLVQYVFQKQYVFLPRTSQEMWSYSTSVTDLKPGDLVFFSTYAPGPSHVGIYIGNNQFISALSSGVKIDTINSSYWAPKYLGAKRVE